MRPRCTTRTAAQKITCLHSILYSPWGCKYNVRVPTLLLCCPLNLATTDCMDWLLLSGRQSCRALATEDLLHQLSPAGLFKKGDKTAVTYFLQKLQIANNGANLELMCQQMQTSSVNVQASRMSHYSLCVLQLSCHQKKDAPKKVVWICGLQTCH